MNKPTHSYKGIPLRFMAQCLLKCADDSRNPDIGNVNQWVEKGNCYWASNIEASGQYQGEVVFDLFDNKQKQIIPNETYQKWKGSRFMPITTMICSN
ncbi:MAG: hypothetical protein P8J32_04610 [bacterium]|nr:hypothetical protein [bacterium]